MCWVFRGEEEEDGGTVDDGCHSTRPLERLFLDL